jgi:NAD(P)-dependent dehydrogenase (short-subunit alcohol dehydrogenase family)
MLMRRRAILSLAALTIGAIALGAPPFNSAAAQSVPEPSMQGKTVLITGSTDGLGRETARALAARGAHVIVHGRNADRGKALVDEITKSGKGSARFYAADFASLAAVRAFADTILANYPRLDLLVNNAGVLGGDAPRRTSSDGHELHFAINYLAGFLLTERLLPRLRASTPARIVNVASRAQQPIDFNNVMLETGYNGGRGYAQSKLAQITYTKDLSERLKGSGISVYALHPASMMNTTMVRDIGASPRSTVEEGLASVLHAIDATDAPSGTYFNGQVVASPHAQAMDTAAQAKLRALSQQLTGQR